MFIDEAGLHWGATDLSEAAECEYRLLRELDYRLGRVERPEQRPDPFVEHLGLLGDEHERAVLAELREARNVVMGGRVDPPYTAAAWSAARDATAVHLQTREGAVYQAALGDGEFAGFADFLIWSDDAWQVCDAKLARTAKPKALLQISAYADQLIALGVPVAPIASLLLGGGRRADFPLERMLPVFRERRARLRKLLAAHSGRGQQAAWGDDDILACGVCPECEAAIEATDDVRLVAGMRMEQREKLRRAGVTTISELAEATTRPDRLGRATFDKLRAQAALQWRQRQAGPDAPPIFELTDIATQMLVLIPEPSDGDVLFDFEGDPLYDEPGSEHAGLEYLWGIMDVEEDYMPWWAHDRAQERDVFVRFIDYLTARRGAYPGMHVYHYAPYETAALKRLAMRYQVREEELDELLRGEVFVDLYATVRGAVRISRRSYSIKKLEPFYMGDELRESDVADGAGSVVAYLEYRHLAARDPERSATLLDSLADYNKYDCLSTLRLRDWLVRLAAEPGARGPVSGTAADPGANFPSHDDVPSHDGFPSHEDVLGDALASDGEPAGDGAHTAPSPGGVAGSRDDPSSGDSALPARPGDAVGPDPDTGAGVAGANANASASAGGAGVGGGDGAGDAGAGDAGAGDDTGRAADPLFDELMDRAGTEAPLERSREQQAYAMLATALDYYRREDKQHWWEHFDRLSQRIEDWPEARDVFVVESAAVAEPWHLPGGRARNERRTLRLVGDWSPGSKLGAKPQVIYEAPGPAKTFGPDGGCYAAGSCSQVEADPVDPRVVHVTESRPAAETFPQLPSALTPGPPPPTDKLQDAIAETARRAADSAALPECAELDILARRQPRLGNAAALSHTAAPLHAAAPSHTAALSHTAAPLHTDTARRDIVGALTSMDDSYVAVQGPPGAGKTFNGSRVITELVQTRGWRIGVVAQSHAVVENMLDPVVAAGLDPRLVGKVKPRATSYEWTAIGDEAAFFGAQEQTGCVIGGTAWTFANENKIPRGGLDLLVIDEAGQFSLAHTLASAVAARRLLLLGDPRQLPQVSQATHAEPVDESALGWIMAGDDTIAPEAGYFLAETYRMHPELCEEVSRLSYGGNLTAAAPAAARDLADTPPGLAVVRLDHRGNRTESPEEAAEVVARIQALIGTAWTDPSDHVSGEGSDGVGGHAGDGAGGHAGDGAGVGDHGGNTGSRPLTEADFLVVAPYNAQVALIRDALDAAGLTEVPAGTVDKFQGQQAPVAIVSMTASSRGDVPRGMDFLLSRNRINVAISRAQWQAILIRSTELTAFMPASTDGLIELGAFIGLCEDAAVTE